jgi:hypothetical protein
VHCAVFTWEDIPRSSIVVMRGSSLVGLIRHLGLEGALNVAFHESALPERVLDGDLMVWTRRVQELLEVVPGWCRLGRVALGA